MRIGVVAEGSKDEPIFQELIPRIDPRVTRVDVRPAAGKPKFLHVFPGLLWTFPYVAPGGIPNKAIVVRDSNGDDPAEIEQRMRQRLQGRQQPPFHGGIEFHATRRESETWLLADVGAISRVAARQGGGHATPVLGPLEEVPDAKERFVRMLVEAGLLNVERTVREVVREIELDILRTQCPGFVTFEQKVLR